MTDDPGAIIFNAMLKEFRFHEILSSCYPVEEGNLSAVTIGNTLFGMAYFGINKFSDFRVLNFKGLELLVGSYSVPGEYTVRRLVNMIKQADFAGEGVQRSIIENLRLWKYDKRVIGTFRRQFIKIFKDKGIIDGKIVFVDGHFKPYWGAVEIPKGFSRTHGVMKGIYEFFGHDVNGNAICSLNMPGDSDLHDGTDFVKQEIITALGDEYAKLMVVDREGMSGEQLKRYEDESRSILGILRHSREVERQLDAVEFHDVYDTDSDGNPVLMIEEVPLEVPNYRTHEEITEEGKVKSVNGTINCIAIHNLKKDRRYAIAHTAKEEIKKEEAVDLYKKRFPVQENDFKYKKKGGSLDTLHGYDFYEVENRQHNNWLEKKESRLRGCLRSINARRKEIVNLKGKIERIEKKARTAHEKLIRKLLRKNKQLEGAKEKVAAAVRAQTRKKHEAAEKKREGEIVEIEQTIEREQREAGEKIAACHKAIEEKEEVIKKLEREMEVIENEISGQPKTMFEMNTALLDFIILLLILRDNMHSYLMKEFFGEPFTRMNFYTAYKCIYQQQARVKLIGNTLHVIYIKVPGKWREDMREAFERINERGIITPEGWRIHLEI